MKRRLTRYSDAFKRHVVAELEAGVYPSANAAARHYGIGDCVTVVRWLRQLGRAHLVTKVIRVEHPDEATELVRLRRQVRELESALAKTQTRALLTECFLEIACEQAGVSLEDIKKKAVTTPSTGLPPGEAGR